MKLGVEQHDRVHDAQCRNRPAGSRADSPPIALAMHLGDQLERSLRNMLSHKQLDSNAFEP